MEVVWDNEKVLKLIEAYESQKVLWDYSSKDAKNKVLKNTAWENMSKALGIPQRDVENKMHILRSQFAREKKRIFTSGGDAAEKTRWIFYDALKFLLGVSTPNLQSWNNGSPNKNGNSENNNRKAEEEHISESQQRPTPSTSWSSSTHYQRPIKRRIDENNLSRMLEIVKAAKKRANSESSIQSKDEFEVYAQYVASELRAVKNENAALQAKSYINEILINARMGKYNFPNKAGHTYEATSSATGTDPQEELEFVNLDEIKIESEAGSESYD